jgi:3-dehydroquinate synthase
MRPIDQAVRVSFRYPVHFTTDLFSPNNSLLRDVLAGDGLPTGSSKVLCVVDSGVAEHHLSVPGAIAPYFEPSAGPLTLVAPPVIVNGGESVKNDPAQVTSVHRAIHEYGIDRHAYVLAVGGGALLDMVGYAAATAHRGVRLVRVPTTVLSQNDSGIGVKNSVNAFGKKNFLGTFAPPFAVFNDFTFLTTLSDRDWRAGISEAIKVALLKDATFFAFLEEHATPLVERDMAAMQWLVYRCAELHLEHIATSGDPFELGSSRPLDFGHWAAHKLEQLSNYELRHGEAVAIGLALDATYAHLIGLLPQAEWRRILDLIVAVGLPLHVPELDMGALDGTRAVLAGMEEFREHLGGRLTIMLLEGIGRGIEVHEMDSGLILASMTRLKTYAIESGATELPGGVLWSLMPSVAPSPSGS